MKTSMSPLSFTIASTSDPRSSERPALRRGLPTTIWLTLRSRASCSTALGMLAPETLAVSAPSCSASSKAAARWPRSAALSVGWPGLSTQATIHSARSRVASRRAARTSRPLSGFGRMQTSSRSAIGQVRLDRVIAPIVLDGCVHVLGRAPQRQLAERRQVALAEELLDRARGLVGQVDLALLEPAQQVLGRQVHELDLVRLVEQAVGQRLAHHDSGDALDEVVHALEVLDVECRPDVDAGLDQLARVLPALGVARARRVRVRELVEQQHAGLARERLVDVELQEPHAAVLDLARRQPLEALGERRRLGPPVRLDPADHHVDTRGALGARRLEHGVGLADAGGGAEEDLEASALRVGLVAPDALQQGVGVRPLVAHLGLAWRLLPFAIGSAASLRARARATKRTSPPAGRSRPCRASRSGRACRRSRGAGRAGSGRSRGSGPRPPPWPRPGRGRRTRRPRS